MEMRVLFITFYRWVDSSRGCRILLLRKKLQQNADYDDSALIVIPNPRSNTGNTFNLRLSPWIGFPTNYKLFMDMSKSLTSASIKSSLQVLEDKQFFNILCKI